MLEGKIKTLTDKGYGFIIRQGENKDLFFHAKSLSGVTYEELQVGDSVRFDIVEGQKGLAAVEVCRA